jgi:hypothetical protein
MCQVVNKNNSEFDVIITRGTIWGNRFAGPGAIEKFEEQLKTDISNGRITVAKLAELDGQRLGCVCKPKPCHGDVIAKYVAWAINQQAKGSA